MRILVEQLVIKYRGVEQLVACRAHNPEVAGSNPASATKSKTAVDTRYCSNGCFLCFAY